MSLKKLTRFLQFNSTEFFKDKRFKALSISPWTDYDTKERIGNKIEVVIVSDRTDYGCKDGETVSNIYEKLIFKVAKDANVKAGMEIVPINPICNVYGDYRNMLSVVCEEIEVVGK